MNQKPILLLLVFGVLLAANVYAGGWYDTDWQYRREITIQSDKVTADLTNFPVLVATALDSAKAQADGDDILFTSSDGTTKLDHEIESYDSGTGELVAWVRVLSVLSATDTMIYVYYGNSSVGSQENPTDVWDSDYAMVQHLEEASGNVLDSTANGNNGTPQGGVTYDSDGKIDGAIQFDGADDTIPTVYPSDSDKTLEVWIKWDKFPVTSDETTGCHDGANHRFYVGYKEANWFYGMGSIFGTTDGLFGVGENEWVYLTVTGDGSNARFYVNGELKNVTSYVWGGTSTHAFHIGSRTFGTGPSNFIDGIIDEVKISNAVRSADWIKTTYNNQNDVSSFLGIKGELQYSDTPAISNPSPSDGSFGEDLNPELSVDVEDFQDDLMTITFKTNVTGSWQDLCVYNNAASDTYSVSPTNMDDNATEYYWRVVADDGKGNIGTETFKFTTKGLWWDNGWRARKLITIDKSAVNGAHADFPVLIDIEDNDLVGALQENAEDIVFTSYEGVKLDHEIELYDNGHLVAWVETSVSADEDIMLYMYYGNSGCAAQENPGGVWDANYVGVWHMKEDDTTVYDSTSNDNDGTKKSATEPQAVSGIIDGSQNYDGADDYIGVGSSVLPTGSKTINTWVKMPPTGCTGGSGCDYIFYSKSGTTFFFYFNDGLEIKILGTGGSFIYSYAVDDSTWHNVVFTRDGTTAKLYIDGSEVHSISDAADSIASEAEYIGGETGTSQRGWLGDMDEIRISNIARSGEWIETAYNLVKDDVFEFGDEEENPDFTGKAFVFNPDPEDGEIDVEINPRLSIDVLDLEGDNMDITFETDASGSWQVIQTYTGVGDGTYTANPTNMDQTDTIYNWRINVTDDGSNELVSKTFSIKTMLLL